MSQPLVSCIMPTRNRREFVRQSVRYFLRQDFPERELVVVDDGEDAVADLAAVDPRIRYVRLDRPTPLGAKRNLACGAARGEVIAHWDDDDWIGPHRLRVQVAGLLDGGADLCGVSELLYYQPSRGRAWLRRPGLAGCTLVYRRSAWEAHPFPDSIGGEDGWFIGQFDAGQCRAVADSSLYLAVLHASNISTTAPPAGASDAPGDWEPRPLDEVGRLLADDRDFYVALRRGRGRRAVVMPPGEVGGEPDAGAAADPVPAGPVVGRPASGVGSGLTVASHFLIYDGYGSVAEYLVRGLARSGVPVDVHAFRIDRAGLSAEFLDILARSQPDFKAPTLCFTWPLENVSPFRSAADLFFYTMWETSRLPAGWAAFLNRPRSILVPSTFCADSFRASGVTIPIDVVPHGVDPDVYPYEERPDRAGVTTLIVGVFATRKNIYEGIAAWKLAFADDPDARLVIKTRFRQHPYVPDDPRITFADSEEPSRGIAHWYRQADVLVALGNEGFGLPLIEGMATGLPVVALSSEGQADVCAAARDLVLPVSPARWVAFDEPPFGACGVRGVPAPADVAARLRWVADHRAEARALGRAASAWVLKHRNIWDMAPAILDVIERRGRSGRTFRPAAGAA